jgi:hypothetical protein
MRTAPQGWVKFETLKNGAKFHDHIGGGSFGGIIQFIKIEQCFGLNAVRLDNGVAAIYAKDEFVYPIDTGWIVELECYGIKLPKEMKEKQDHREIVAYIFSQCEARKEGHRWRTAIEKYFPQLGIMSFSGAERTIQWLMERVTVKADEAALAAELIAIENSPGLTDDEKVRSRLETLFPNLRKKASCRKCEIGTYCEEHDQSR